MAEWGLRPIERGVRAPSGLRVERGRSAASPLANVLQGAFAVVGPQGLYPASPARPGALGKNYGERRRSRRNPRCHGADAAPEMRRVPVFNVGQAVCYRCGRLSDFCYWTGQAYRDRALSSSATTQPRPTDRELDFAADRADHCRQGISRVPLAPAARRFRMQPACHRREPHADRRACSSG
jgi:hypothetical protein